MKVKVVERELITMKVKVQGTDFKGVRIFAIRTSATPYFVSFATPFLCLLPRHI